MSTPDVPTLLGEALREQADATPVTAALEALPRLERSIADNRRRRRTTALLVAAAAVAVVSVGVAVAGDGDDPTPEPADEAPTVQSLPPPGQRILFSGPQGIVVLPAEGGRSVPVLAGSEARFSPDGTLVAYVTVDEQIAVATVGEWEPTILVEDPEPDAIESLYGPIWSSDGSQIAYMQRSDLHAVPADGGASRLLRKLSACIFRPMTFTPDGSEILLGFDRSTTGGTMVVERLDPSTGRLTPFLEGAGDTSGVRYSPDESQIAFYSDSRACICVADADGDEDSIRTVLPVDTEIVDSARIAWSPDGSELAWDERRGGPVHVLDIVTGEDRTLNPGVYDSGGAIDWDRP